MAAPAYVAGGAFANTATKDSPLTVVLPVGWAAGQHAFLQVQTVEQGSGNTAPSIVGPASGWRMIGGENHATGFVNTRQVRTRIYHRVLVGGDTDPTVQMTGGTAVGVNLSAKISTFSDVGVIRFGVATTGGAAISIPGVTSKAANALAVAFLAQADGNTVSAGAFTDPAAPTERHDHTVGSRVGVSMYTGTRATAGATGAFTVTPSGIDPWAGRVMVFEETETFPSESVLEPFTYSDGELDTVSGGDWVDDTFGFGNDGLSVASNRASNAGASDERSYYDTQHEADGEIAVTVPVLPAALEKVALAYRVRLPGTATPAGFEVETNQTGTGLRAFRIDAQVYSQVGLYEQTLIAGDKIGVRFAGSLHEFFVVPASGPKLHIGTLIDGSYLDEDSYGGIAIEGTTARLDDFVLGPLVAGPVPSDVALAPTVTATMAGQVAVAVVLPGAAAASIVVEMEVESGEAIGPSDVALAPTITAVMSGRIVFQEQLGRDYGPPMEIVGPLVGQAPGAVLVRNRRGVSSARLLSRVSTRRRRR